MMMMLLMLFLSFIFFLSEPTQDLAEFVVDSVLDKWKNTTQNTLQQAKHGFVNVSACHRIGNERCLLFCSPQRFSSIGHKNNGIAHAAAARRTTPTTATPAATATTPAASTSASARTTECCSQ